VEEVAIRGAVLLIIAATATIAAGVVEVSTEVTAAAVMAATVAECRSDSLTIGEVTIERGALFAAFRADRAPVAEVDFFEFIK
jgi:hypothetical protein